MPLGSTRLTREEECDRLLKRYGTADFDRLSAALDRQFQTIQDRAQLVLGLCGVLISASVLVTTGRLIGPFSPHTRTVAGPVLVGAGALATLAAAVVCTSVLRIRWTTGQPGDDLRAWVLSNLRYRDRKTLAYRFSVLVVLMSMLAFQTAMSIALTYL